MSWRPKKRQRQLPQAEPLRLDREDWDMVDGKIRIPLEREGSR